MAACVLAVTHEHSLYIPLDRGHERGDVATASTLCFLRKDVRTLIRLITYVPENIAHRNKKDFPGRPLGSVVEDEN